jgi:GntR family transcriptional regulator
MSRERRPVIGPGGTRASKWQHVADDLAQRIRNKDWAPGERLPSEKVLAVEYGTGVGTIRRAVSKLAYDRLVETRHGAGTYVLTQHVIVINATKSEDLSNPDRNSSWDNFQNDVKGSGEQRFECLNTLADRTQAEHFGVEFEAPLILRRCWRYVRGIPSSVESAWYPEWLVQALPKLAVARDIPEGTTKYMADNGYPIGWSEVLYSGRPFVDLEEDFFDAPLGVFALIQFRIALDHREGRKLRLVETVYRTDMHIIQTEVPNNGDLTSVLALEAGPAQ